MASSMRWATDTEMIYSPSDASRVNDLYCGESRVVKRNLLFQAMTRHGLRRFDISLLTDTNTVPLLSALIRKPKDSKEACGSPGNIHSA